MRMTGNNREDVPMSAEPSGENVDDAAASALSALATVVTGLDDWHEIRDWALKGGAEHQIPSQLSGLDSYRAVGTALSADERLAVLVNEESSQRPIVRVGLFGLQLRASALPAGMIASAIERWCLREPYTSRPTPAVLQDMLAQNLNVLRRIAARKTVTLPCLAGARGIRLRPGQASLETVLGTLHSKDAFHVPELAMAGNPDVLITTTVRTQVQVLGARRQHVGNRRSDCRGSEAAPLPSQARAATGLGKGRPGRRPGLGTHERSQASHY